LIRTHVIPCELPRARADDLNRSSGTIYTSVLVQHWRVWRQGGRHWLSKKAGTFLNDLRLRDRPVPKGIHSHSIDAAQQGFYKACVTTRSLRKAGFTEARFPHWTKRFRTTIWKGTGFKREGDTLKLSGGGRTKKDREEFDILVPLPTHLRDCLQFLEVRLVYDKKKLRYSWHIVVENGIQPKPSPGTNVVSVDLGEIHPAVVGDKEQAIVITCRERRSRSQGQAKRLAKIAKAISRKAKGSRRRRRLVRAKVRMKAKHARIMRDIAHKVSHEIVEFAAERKAGTIVIGDVRDIADGIDKGKEHNGRMSRWNHGKIRFYIAYKAEAEGIKVPPLVDEAYTTKTCPNCGHRHKPRGRNFRCPSCGFQAHRDVVGQTNILSRYLEGDVGRLPAPSDVKYRIPRNIRVLRSRCGHQPGSHPRSPGAIPRNSDESEKPPDFSPCGVSQGRGASLGMLLVPTPPTRPGSRHPGPTREGEGLASRPHPVTRKGRRNSGTPRRSRRMISRKRIFGGEADASLTTGLMSKGAPSKSLSYRKFAESPHTLQGWECHQ
jgi:putative transposase